MLTAPVCNGSSRRRPIGYCFLVGSVRAAIGVLVEAEVVTPGSSPSLGNKGVAVGALGHRVSPLIVGTVSRMGHPWR